MFKKITLMWRGEKKSETMLPHSIVWSDKNASSQWKMRSLFELLWKQQNKVWLFH